MRRFVVLLAFGNLRGIREAGRVFAIPTYFFIANMAVLIVAGLVREAIGRPAHAARAHRHHARSGTPSGGLMLGVSAFYLLRAFANGSSAMTGTEAISNGVSIFREPQATQRPHHAGAHEHHPRGRCSSGCRCWPPSPTRVPFVSGTPTVVSEIGQLVYGSSPAGQVLYYSLQAATALILILAANTSFTGFPFLVSFVAEDSFLPRKLTVRGHRLVFSNGILLLAGASIALLLATGAKVAALIPMYAIGVFTGFTMAGAGMAKHHLTHRDQHWRQQRGRQRHRRRRLRRRRGRLRRHRVHPGRLGRRRRHAAPRLRAGDDQPRSTAPRTPCSKRAPPSRPARPRSCAATS